jgi:hypothetical protein
VTVVSLAKDIPHLSQLEHFDNMSDASKDKLNVDLGTRVDQAQNEVQNELNKIQTGHGADTGQSGTNDAFQRVDENSDEDARRLLNGSAIANQAKFRRDVIKSRDKRYATGGSVRAEGR